MKTIRTLAILLVLLAAASLVVLPVAAHNDDDELLPNHDTKIIVDEDGETYVCRIKNGDRIRVVRERDGEEIVDLDLGELNETLEDAMEDLSEAFEELEDIHVDIDWDDDNVFKLDVDDIHISMDMDDVLEDAFEIVSAIGEITLDELDFSDVHIHWDDDGEHRHRIIIDDDDDEDRDDELDRLRDEIKDLKRELRKAKRDRH